MSPASSRNPFEPAAATDVGVVFVAAAGNDGIDASRFSPANSPDTIAVSALADFDGLPGGFGEPTCRVDEDDTLANFSNFGDTVDIAAPGVCILSTDLDDGYSIKSGTSMAAPHVSGIAALMITTSPFWLVLFEALRAGGTKPTWQAILGLILGFVGVFILVGPAEITGVEGGFDTFGIILLLLAPLFWSMGSIYARGADMPRSTLLSTGMQMLTGAVALFLVSLIKGELYGFSLGLVSTRSWLALAYLITFGSLIGFVSYGWLLHNAPVSLLSTYAYVNPVVAVLLGNWLADEPLNGRVLVAAAIIIGSVVLINSARQAKVKTPALQAVPDGDD